MGGVIGARRLNQQTSCFTPVSVAAGRQRHDALLSSPVRPNEGISRF